MHTNLTFRGGFVAMPDEIMRLPISDGAYRLLSLLCSYADRRTGTCFPSLATLADLQGKSKAAISGYLKELRSAGLVSTEQEVSRSTGHGRLTFLVTFWNSWRAKLRTRKEECTVATNTGHSSEQPVQPAERHVNNQTYYNHTLASVAAKTSNNIQAEKKSSGRAVVSCVQKLVEEWQDRRGWAPYPTFDVPITEDLVARTNAAILESASSSLCGTRASISTDIEMAISRLWASVGIQIDHLTRATHAKVIADRSDPLKVLDALGRELRQIWKPYWGKPSSEKQFRDMVDKASQKDSEVLDTAAVRLLRGYLVRFERSSRLARRVIVS